MSVLVFGAAGQVGYELCRSMALTGRVIGVDRHIDPSLGIEHAVDLTDRDAIGAAFERFAPRVVINAAAYTAVDQAEDEPELADRLNHLAVAEMARQAAVRGVLLVHYSTDYVFDGQGTSPYSEAHAPAPVSVYGRSKLAGERALAQSGCAYLLLRTAWVYGWRGRNFLLTILRAAAQRPELSVVDDQIGCPTTAHFLAQCSAALVQRWLQADADGRNRLQGCYHSVLSGQTSWCGFAREIVRQARVLELLSKEIPVHAIRTGEYPAKAPRPAYSVLSCERLVQTLGTVPVPWQIGVRQTLQELAQARQSLRTLEMLSC